MIKLSRLVTLFKNDSPHLAGNAVFQYVVKVDCCMVTYLDFQDFEVWHLKLDFVPLRDSVLVYFQVVTGQTFASYWFVGRDSQVAIELTFASNLFVALDFQEVTVLTSHRAD